MLTVKLCMTGWGVFAQTAPRLQVSFMSEQISLPFEDFSSLHPGIEIAYSPSALITSYGSRGWLFAVGGYHRAFPAQGIYGRAAYQWTWKVSEIVALTGSAGLGYLHTFHTTPVYWHDQESIQQETARLGRSHLLAEAGVQATLFPNKKFSPFISYRFAVETPATYFIPFLPHNFYGFGLNLNI